PNYVIALRLDAEMRAGLVLDGFSSDPDTDLAIAMKMADRAHVLAPNDVDILRAKASVLRGQGNLDGAAAVLHRVIELRPLQPYNHRALGSILLAQGASQGGGTSA